MPLHHHQSGLPKHGEVIPTRHTRDGDNLSPPLEWRDAPPGNQAASC